MAANYNPLSTIDDGSCIIYGCMTPGQNNYSSTATHPCGEPTWNTWPDPFTPFGCFPPACANWGIYPGEPYYINACCVPFINGCMDSTASNYDPLANVDDGSCANFACTTPTPSVYNLTNNSVTISFTYNPQPGDPYLIDADFQNWNLREPSTTPISSASWQTFPAQTQPGAGRTINQGNLPSNTTYEFSLQTTCVGGETGEVVVVTFTTLNE